MTVTDPTSKARSIAIIGGGISGLAAAQRILEREPTALVTLFEAASRLGGVLQTTEAQGFVFEHSADNFMVSDELPWAGELCEKIGLDCIGTAEEHRGALILRDGRLYPVPEGLHLMSVHDALTLLASPLLSWPGRLRVMMEPLIPRRRGNEDESLAQFATRRFGREMFDRIVQPLVSGIYTADPQRLSMISALPQFVAMEQKHGSLWKAAKSIPSPKRDRGARYALFRTPPNGMQQLVDTLVRQLDEHVDFRLNTHVRSVHQQNGHWVVTDAQARQSFDRIVIATPAPVCGKLIASTEPTLSELMKTIEQVSTTVVCFGLRRSQIARPLDAFGFVVPACEGRRILAGSFTHVKFPTRCSPEHAIIRVFLGGALQPELAELDDSDSVDTAWQEVAQLLGIRGTPLVTKLLRWKHTTPQYNLGHRETVNSIEAKVAELRGLEFAGNAYQGIGIPQCVRSGWNAADRTLAFHGN